MEGFDGLDSGGGMPVLGSLFLIGVAVLAIILVGGGFVLDKSAELEAAKAERAMAIAAQTQAQASLIDARTAQIGMVGQAALPYLVALFALLVVAAMGAGVYLYILRRDERMAMIQAEVQRYGQQQYGQPAGRLYQEQTELLIPSAPAYTREPVRTVAVVERRIESTTR